MRLASGRLGKVLYKRLLSLRKKRRLCLTKLRDSHRARVDILLFPQLLWWLVARMLFILT